MNYQDDSVSVYRTSTERLINQTTTSCSEKTLSRTRLCQTCHSPVRLSEREKLNLSSSPTVVQVKPTGYRSPSLGLSVIGVKRNTSVPDSRKLFLTDSKELSKKSSDIKLEGYKLQGEQTSDIYIRSEKEVSNLQPVVHLKRLDAFSVISIMRKGNLTPRVPVASTRQSPDLRSRSVLPRKKSNNDSPKTRSPRKKKSESPDKMHAPLNLDIPEYQLHNRSGHKSPKSVSPRSYGDYSPQKKELSPLQTKELSPRELDAIKTLKKLKARSPQKKAITNEMRKSACHSKQNERRDSIGTPGLQKTPENKSKMTIPKISVTDTKGVKVKESPKRGRRKATKTISEQETAMVIKTEAKSSPKKRGRQKKSSTSSPNKSDMFPYDESLYDIPGGLNIESSGISRKRVRSPSARYKQDMIMYPWDSPRKKQSPKKSPTDKSPTAGTSKEYDSSSSEESSLDETTDTNVDNESPIASKQSVKEPSRDSILSAARVLNFDEVDTHEYSKIGETLFDADKYRSLLHTAQDKVATDLIGLSILISKVSGAVDKPNEDLLNLFGAIEEPDYCDDNVTYQSDNEEEKISNSQEESNETLVERDTYSAKHTENTSESTSKESMQGNLDTGQGSRKFNSEENVNKQKTDSDLDSTLEYGKDISPSVKKVAKSSDNTHFPSYLQKNIVSSELTGASTSNFDSFVDKEVDMTSASLILDACQSETKIKIDQHAEDLKGRNVFDLFNDKDDKMENSNSEMANSIVESFSDNEVLEHVSEDSIPDILDTIDNMSSESSAPLRDNETLSKQLLDSKDGSNNQEIVGVSENAVIDLDSKDEIIDRNDVQKVKDHELEQVSKEKVINDEDSDLIIVSQTMKSKTNNVIVLSDNESDNKNINESTLKTDRRGFEQLRSSPRSVPLFSTVRKNFSEPSPLTVLKSVEKATTDKNLAFISHELDDYLKPYAPVTKIKDNSESAAEKKSPTKKDNKNDSDPCKAMECEAASGLDASDKCVADVVAKVHSPRPDLDQIDDCMFLSFASEEALLAHVELEKKLDWLDEINLKRMINMMNKDKVSEHDAATPSKSPHSKHNMRGVPGRITKYRKMLKQEYDIILKAKENRVPPPLRTKTPEKTTDITKIKGWKKKFANTAELEEATGLHFSEAGKLHWRTEERIIKQMEPDDVKEIGLDLKKKRRKLVHYTKRKGESKTDKPKHSETLDEGEEPLPLTAPDNLNMLEDENSREPEEKIPYSVRYSSQHKYGKRKMFVKQMKMNAEDENILKKLGSQKIAEQQKKKGITDPESKPKRNKAITYVIKLSHSLALAAVSALNKKLMIKAKAIARQKSKKKEHKAKFEKAKQVDEVDNDTVHEIRDKLESSSESDGEGSDGYEEIPENEISKEILDEEEKGEILKKGDNGSKTRKTDNQEEDQAAKSKACDQPGCRYGCICHLYKFSEKDSEKEDSDHKPPCDKEYCRLGCICDSIDTKMEDQSHCRKPDCMFGCKCRPKNRNQQESEETSKDRRRSKDGGQQKGRKRSRRKRPQSRKSSLDDEDMAELPKETEENKGDKSDWEPPAKKQRESTKTPAASTPWFADLPKRETKYRLAKNLDAVTRKAKQVYESSEMYMEQRVRRRRSDPVIEMVNDGDFLDNLPPDWRDSFELEPSSSTARPDSRSSSAMKQAEEDQDDTVQPSTSMSALEVSEDEDEAETSLQEERSCARTAGYSGHRKCNKPFLVENSPEVQTEGVDKGSSKTKETVLIDLVDSDCEVTEVRHVKSRLHPRAEDATREMTASEKLGMNKRRPSQDREGKKPSTDSKWKTQMVCLKAKKKVQPDSQPSGAESEIKLLEIISNCNWEADRANMLSKISHIISKDYSKSHVVLWNNYALQFLPKANKPAVIPPELQAKLPNSMYSIRIRVTQNLNDIEKAENESGKGDSTASERLLAEKVKSLSDKDKEQYASLTSQKKLIDKIRFAEKLKELIEQEEKKGTYSSKFSISKDGIEKALKRYKTQLWRAYTGNSNMTLSQLREAVMKAKTSNYTEKINQAITAIEQKAQDTVDGTAETSESNITVVGATNAQDLASVTTVTDTIASEAITDTTKSVTDTTTVKPGSDLRTLSSSAKARIEANQGIVIKGSAHSIPASKAPVTRLITQGGKQSDIYLVPVTGDNASVPVSLPGKMNLMSNDGTTNVINLQPVLGSATAFKISSPDPGVTPTLAALKPPTTSTSAPIVVSAAVPKSTAPVTSPLTVTTLGAPVPSSLGTPRMFKPILSSSVAKPVRMQMLVNGHPENIQIASPVGAAGPAPVILSGTINGQKVLAIQKINASQSSHVASTSVHSAVVTSNLKNVSQNSGNLVTLTANVAENGKNLQKVVSSQTSQGIIQVSSSGISRSQLPVTMVTNTVNGPQAGPVSNPFYPPVRLVAANTSNQFVPLINSQQIVGKPIVSAPQPLNVGSQQPVPSIPQQLVPAGPRQMVPIRLINPTNSNTIVQLIPVTSAPAMNSDSAILKSMPGSKPEFIAVPVQPVHFDKTHVASQGNSTVPQTLVNGLDTPSSGIKTLHRSSSPGAAFISTPHGVLKAVPVTTHRPVSPATNLVPLSLGKNTENDLKMISIPQTEMCPITKASDASKMHNEDSDKKADIAVPEIEYIGSYKLRNESTTTNEIDSAVEKIGADKNASSDIATAESHVGEETEKRMQRRKKKSYADKLDALKKLDMPACVGDSAISCDENIKPCGDNQESAETVNLGDDAEPEKLNESKRNNLCENLLSTEMIKLSKTTEDTLESADELKSDLTTNCNKLKQSIEVDSVNGDSNCNNNVENSPSVLSESSETGSVNINTVIDNTTNAGLQLASVLGNTLDSPVIDRSAQERKPTNVVSVSEKPGVIEHEESEAVLLDEVSEIDNDSQDSDGCLIIDENYVSPTKRRSSSQDMETPGSGASKKQKLEDIVEETEGNERCRNTNSGSKEETSQSGDPLQICIEDSEDDADVEILGSNIVVPCAEAPKRKRKRHKRSQPITADNVAFIPTPPVQAQIGRISPTEYLLDRDSVPHTGNLQKVRRKEMKKKFTTLAKLVLMFNPDVKQKYINFITDSTVQLPKMMILDGAKDLIVSLHEEYQCLSELLTDGKQYNESLRNKLRVLTDSFVEEGHSEIVVNNFLKGVASSVKMMREIIPDSQSEELKVKPRKNKSNQSSATAVPSSQSGATIVPTNQSSATAVPCSQSSSTIIPTSQSSATKVSINQSNATIVPTSQYFYIRPGPSSATNVLSSQSRDSSSQLKKTAKIVSVDLTNEFKESVVVTDCINNVRKMKMSLLKNTDTQHVSGPKKGSTSESPVGSSSLSSGHKTEECSVKLTSGLEGDSSHKGVGGESSAASGDMYTSAPSATAISNNDNSQLGRTIVLKACDIQEKCDDQSSAARNQTNHSFATVIQTSQSNETSSQTSSQSSEKIVLMDSADLENSAAKINHSELMILDDLEAEEQGQVHHLDDILDEWSAKICSQ